MISDKIYRRIAYTIIIAGVVLSLWIAVVPHFDAGHRLDVYLLLLGLLPYLIYGVLTAVLHRWALLIPGLLTLAVDLLLRLPERLQTADPVDGDWLIIGPVISSLVILPAGLFIAWRLGRARFTEG
jgi:hypothetical protein